MLHFSLPPPPRARSSRSPMSVTVRPKPVAGSMRVFVDDARLPKPHMACSDSPVEREAGIALEPAVIGRTRSEDLPRDHRMVPCGSMIEGRPAASRCEYRRCRELSHKERHADQPQCAHPRGLFMMDDPRAPAAFGRCRARTRQGALRLLLQRPPARDLLTCCSSIGARAQARLHAPPGSNCCTGSALAGADRAVANRVNPSRPAGKRISRLPSDGVGSRLRSSVRGLLRAESGYAACGCAPSARGHVVGALHRSGDLAIGSASATS